MSKMGIFGHRGASVQEAENTFASIQKALEVCDGAEFDIQRTLDGHLVVLHDKTLQRTANIWSQDKTNLSEEDYYTLVNKNVTELNFEDFKHIKVGRSHEPHGFGTSTDPEEESHQLSSLPDILNLVKLYPSKQLLIEIKGDKQSAPLIHRDIIQNGANPAQVHIIGFCFDTMIDLKQLLPSFSSILICHQKSSEDALLWIDKASDAELDGIDFLADHNTVTSEVVTKAHKLNLKVLVYVGKEFDIETSWDALLSAEVDVFTSDLPPAVYPWMARQEALRDCTNTKTCHVVDVPKTPYSPLSVSTPKRDITGTLLSHPTSVMSPRLAAADEVGLVDMIKEGVVESVIDDGLLKSPKMIKVES